ncbi:Short-chain dehydrogenase/reductase SDR [Macrophomina phaseolina MS6]|uniref:Short-chain dehydrogenase/reductase SDR n=2 Tax=Macrophomina phaseolina TaxID=35725 RepID=K2RIN4_MACPH|nr:Short-chain dehydrogenase/reductase SDR [Macrophomina phaseolina MS6]KAH7012394.1 short-chain dehydrogenase-like protein [Macrophomina phaseolina]
MASYFVTGSSRGLGLGLVSLLAARPDSEVSKVFASARSETPALQKLSAESGGRVEFVQLEVTSQESMQKAAGQVEHALAGKGLDVLINNAGVADYVPDGISAMTTATLEDTFKVNVTGVHIVTSALLPLLEKGAVKKVINVSSTMGSVAMSPSFAWAPTPAYKISKAALNMLTAQYAQAVADKGFTVVALSPGWIKTDLGSANADLTIEQGSSATLDIVLRVKEADNGKFFNVHVPGWENAKGPNKYDGAEVPW